MNISVEWKSIADKDIGKTISNATNRIKDNINKIASDIYKKDNIKLIFICGPSASGKTSFANMLKAKFDSMGMISHTLSLDDFFRNRADLTYINEDTQDFDSINALDTDAVKQCFNELLNNNMAYIPQFDFISGERQDKHKLLKMESNDVIIIEGIHSFNPLIQGEVDNDKYINIYIEPMTDVIFDNYILSSKKIRLIRRIIRDMYTRGHTIDSTLKQWRHVRDSEDVNIYPFVDKADYSINTFAEYELMVYKYLLYPKLERYNRKHNSILEILENVNELKPQYVPEDSLIREFTNFEILLTR